MVPWWKYIFQRVLVPSVGCLLLLLYFLVYYQRGFDEAHADDGLLEIFGLKQGWHASFVMVELISTKHYSIKRWPERYVVPPTRMILLASRFKQWMGKSTFPFCWLDEISRFSSFTKFFAIDILNCLLFKFLFVFAYLWFPLILMLISLMITVSIWWIDVSWIIFVWGILEFMANWLYNPGLFLLYSDCLIKFPNEKIVIFKEFWYIPSWNMLITIRKSWFNYHNSFLDNVIDSA